MDVRQLPNLVPPHHTYVLFFFSGQNLFSELCALSL